MSETPLTAPEPPPDTASRIEPAVALAILVNDTEHVAAADIKVTDRGITFLGPMTWDRYFQLLTVWHRIGQTWYLGLADILRQGRLEFGDLKVAEAVTQLEFELADATRGYTIGGLAPEVRSLGLTSEHFFVLGKMLDSEKEQEKWAQDAIKEKLTGAELKKSIEAGHIVHQTEVNNTSGRGSGIPNVQGLTLWFGRWIKQVGGIAVVMRWTPDLKRAWLEEVREIVDLAHKLEDSLGPDPKTPGQQLTSADAPGAAKVV